MEITLSAEEMVKMLGWNAQQIITYLQKKFNKPDNNLISTNENNTYVVDTYIHSKNTIQIVNTDYLSDFKLLLKLQEKWKWICSLNERNLFEWWEATKEAYPKVNHEHELTLIDAWHSKNKHFHTAKTWDGEWAFGSMAGGIRNWFKLVSSYRDPNRNYIPHQLKRFYAIAATPVKEHDQPNRLISIDEIKYQGLIQQAPNGIQKLHRIYQQLDYSFIKIANLDIPKVDLSSEDIQFLKAHADVFAGIAIMLDRYKASA